MLRKFKVVVDDYPHIEVLAYNVGDAVEEAAEALGLDVARISGIVIKEIKDWSFLDG